MEKIPQINNIVSNWLYGITLINLTDQTGFLQWQLLP